MEDYQNNLRFYIHWIELERIRLERLYFSQGWHETMDFGFYLCGNHQRFKQLIKKADEIAFHIYKVDNPLHEYNRQM